jgi:hypothetical protein
MNCVEIQFKISEWIDGETLPSEELALKGHLDRCVRCSRVYEDLRVIRQGTQELGDLEPAASVWSGIQQRLSSEAILSEKKKTLWGSLFSANLSFDLKPALGAAIVTLILIVSSYFFLRKPDMGEGSLPISTERAVLLKVKNAESQYQQAIEALNEVSQQKLDSLSPELSRIFTDNLATMDYYLKECQEAARKSPENPLIQHHLLVAYQKKVELLQTVLGSYDSQ